MKHKKSEYRIVWWYLQYHQSWNS